MRLFGVILPFEIVYYFVEKAEPRRFLATVAQPFRLFSAENAKDVPPKTEKHTERKNLQC